MPSNGTNHWISCREKQKSPAFQSHGGEYGGFETKVIKSGSSIKLGLLAEMNCEAGSAGIFSLHLIVPSV